MDELQKYLDILFADYGHSVRAMEMKAGLLVNMSARLEQLQGQGLSEAEAVAEIKSRVSNIGQLVEGNRLVYIRRFRNDCLQAAVVYAVVAWIFSMPLIVLLSWVGTAVALLFMLAAAAAAWLYITQSKPDSAEVQFLNALRYKQRRGGVWQLWLLLFGIAATIISIFTFVLGEPPQPAGAGDWARLIARYYAPLLTIAIPLMVVNMDKLIDKNEVGNEVAADA